jgi:hypothetical protein
MCVIVLTRVLPADEPVSAPSGLAFLTASVYDCAHGSVYATSDRIGATASATEFTTNFLGFLSWHKTSFTPTLHSYVCLKVVWAIVLCVALHTRHEHLAVDMRWNR